MNVLLSPNGKPSNLTPEQYKLVRTKAFKEWFGNWENDPANASKVVDENGEPMVVLHGTNNEVNIFKKSKNKSYANNVFGFFFTTEKWIANSYGENIKYCFLNLKNVITLNNTDFQIHLNYKTWDDNLKTLKEYKKDKIDGIYYKHNIYVAFEPNQIKLADGSNTTFDGNNPDIRFEEGGDVNWNLYRYREVEKEIFELKEQGKSDTLEYFNLIKERAILEQEKMKKSKNNYAKGGSVIAYKKDFAKFNKIGVADKYVIEAISEIGLQGINFDKASIEEAILNIFNDLLKEAHTNEYIISEDSKAITNAIQNDIRARYNQGDTEENIREYQQILNNNSKRKELYIDKYAESQKETINEWISYLKQSEYPVAIKYLLLKSVLNFNYDYKTNVLIKRTAKTIRNFTPFDAGSLSELIPMNSDYLLKDYTQIQVSNAVNVLRNNELSKTSSGGSWLKFDGGSKTDEKKREENSKELSKLVQNTYWCTKTNAKSQLDGGDFYVYVTENNGEFFPRIAIRMDEDKVGEVRGNKSSAQDLEDDIIPIAKEFLENNLDNDSGKKWLDGIDYNQKALDLYNKLNSEGLFENSVEEFIELKSKEQDNLLDYADRNGHIVRIERLFQNLIKLPNEFYKKNEIVFDLSDFNPELTRIILGNAYFRDSQVTDLGNLTAIGGYAYFKDSQVTDLGNLTTIGGDAYFSNSQVTSLGNLTTIGDDAYFGKRKDLEEMWNKRNSPKMVVNTENKYAKGGKVVISPADIQKYKKIGIEDKYFIEASKDVGLQGINFDSESVSKRIEEQFNYLLENYEDYLINEDSPSITNYINNEIETHKEQGSSLENIQRFEQMKDNEYARRTIIDDIAKTQKESLDKWIDYLRLSEYKLPFKFLILKAVLNFNYDLKQNKLFERGNSTIRNYTPFDAGSLAELNEKNSDFLLMDYNVIMNENSSKILNSQEVVEQSGNGKWIKFNGGRKTKPEDIEKNGNRLMNLVQNTYWCTKSAGTSQLRGGDFYVYITESNGEIFPRIAVRMNEDKVGEVRGNKSSAQDLDAEMLPIAEEFLNKNIPNDSGKKWLDSIKYNKKCVEMRKRFEAEGMYKDFIYDYIKLIADKEKYRVDYGANGNVTLLKQKLEEIIKIPNEYYKKGDIVTDYRFLSPNTIYFIGNLGRYEFGYIQSNRENGNNEITDLSNWKLKLISGYFETHPNLSNLGNIEFVGNNLEINSNTTDLGKIKYVGNELILSQSVKTLSNIESIGGGLTLKGNIKDLGKLKKVGFLEIMGCDETFSFGSLEEIEGDLTIMEKSVDIDFGNLKTIGGNFNASNTLITDLKNLESVGGYFFIAGSKIKKFENLKSIGGNADFSNNFCPSTQNIETILGDIKFLNSRIMEFPKLNKIGGTIEFRGSFFKSFGNIKYIGDNLNLAESKIEDLGNLEYVGGYVSFKGCKVQTLNKLKKIVSFANFEGSEVTDLGDLESVGGNLYLRLSKIKSLGKLNYVGGLIYMMKNNYSGLEGNYEEIQRQLTN